MMNITFETVISLIVTLSVISVFVAIFADFMLYEKNNKVVQSKKSIVATGNMTGFFIFYYIIVRLGFGNVRIENDVLYIAILTLGTIMIVAGAIINILGRIKLKDNWSNHIKIYDNHTIVTKGVYKVVRHPLYASIILMLFGGSLVYRNLLTIFLTCFIFIPFMYYRAKQEETLLESEFQNYKTYKQNTGMTKKGGKQK